MLVVVVRRFLAYVPVLGVVLVLVFLLSEITPGDKAALVAGDLASPEQVETVRHQLGLDRPAPERLWSLVTSTVRGDFGTSIYNKRSVTEAIGQALPITLSLAASAMVLAVVIGVPSGIAAGLRPGTRVDRFVSAAAAFALAVPPFVLGFLLVIPLAVQRRVFPATGYATIGDGVGEWLRHLLLPALALALALAAEIARQMRGALVDTMSQDFIRAKQSSGLTAFSVVVKHALRNSAIPVITVIGLQAGRVLGGAVVVETIFAMPGLGSLAYQAVLGRDLPMIQGVVLVSALLVLTANLLVDISYVVLNPRLRS